MIATKGNQFPNYYGPPYVGPNTIVESPRWKEFTERRNFPGDNVIVTLYEGPAYRNRIVDRITYNQRDVENAAIDDVIRTTFRQLEHTDATAGLPLGISAPGRRAYLNLFHSSSSREKSRR